MRSKEFDLDVIAKAAMRTFWLRGYSGTSIQNLVDDTGLGRGSLYNTFGSKHGLYEFALQSYYEMTASYVELLTRNDSVKDLIRQLLLKIVSEELNDTAKLGCMVANASLEMARHDSDIANLVAMNLSRMEHALSTLILRGQVTGEIAPTKKPIALARFIVSTIQGIRVVSKGAPQTDRSERLADIVDVAMSTIE
ncbi:MULTISPECIES: TetR/AcrR family transcriptional regulator [Xenorhabdus]|uniref:TetR/AcrR family transcriptional regulator n=1 Tax=Xenorhabdus TaxID=626 RepID=UPI000649DE22|nr:MULTISPECIES: TetR/AcrR family transcriptional regulator [Xenorhabdus]KLU14850.1 TetR family transcriptional regulator [Xenorhabdus griffiniae]KOP32683.1 TetR family transcriptional regulator [Xenorhabdus sp. GDc328]WFQ79114.1 TetR/AcrR family transcriptional regulator [Xenorhabdus sp. SF857]